MPGTARMTLVPPTGATGSTASGSLTRSRPCGLVRPRASSSGRARRSVRAARPAAAAVRREPAPSRGRPATARAAARATAPATSWRSPGRRRITRRGRLLLVGILALLLLATFSLGRASSSADTPTGRPSVSHVTVHPGETMWQFATRVAPGNDPRVTVQRLMQLNGMTTPALRAGQSLIVPAR